MRLALLLTLFQSPAREVGETVVRSPRSLAPATDTRADRVVVTAEELAATGERSLPGQIAKAAGVWLQETNLGGGSPLLQGLSGNQVLLVVDGVRMNDSATRTGVNQMLNGIDPATVERVKYGARASSQRFPSPKSCLATSHGIRGKPVCRPRAQLETGGRLLWLRTFLATNLTTERPGLWKDTSRMARNPRGDTPGTWHHVMNRGIARRTLFETERDIRYFLSRMARSVRAGQIEVHAYCLLTTHFHMLVRSPSGDLAAAMQRIQNEYVRWFNRSRRRDGTLYRGRYCSRPVRTLAYRRLLVRYIDANPVGAGLVQDARAYPHGSARRYADVDGPIWLERGWIESCVRAAGGSDQYVPADYARAFGGRATPALERLVQRRLELPADAEDPLDDLLDAAPERVAAWMRRKATLADGTAVGQPICDVEDVGRVVKVARAAQGEWSVRRSLKAIDAWPQVQVALARDLCAATFAEAGTRVGVTEGGACKLYRRHKECLLASEEYAQRAAELGTAVIVRSQSNL